MASPADICLQNPGSTACADALKSIVGVAPAPPSLDTLAILSALLTAEPIIKLGQTERILAAIRAQASASPTATVGVITRAFNKLTPNLGEADLLGPSLLNSASEVAAFYRDGAQIIVENFPKVVDNDVRAAALLTLKELAGLSPQVAPNANPPGAAIRNINTIAIAALNQIASQPVPQPPAPTPPPQPQAPSAPAPAGLSTGKKVALAIASITATGAVAFLIWTFTHQRRRRAAALADTATQRRSTRAADVQRRGRPRASSRHKRNKR